MKFWTSPRFTSEKLLSGKLEDSIDIYEDRIKGWFLDHARSLLAAPYSEIAVLQLALGYFEGYAIYRNGVDSKGRSKKFFRQAFMEVFPYAKRGKVQGIDPSPDAIEKLADLLYEEARCGLFHEGMIRHRILLAKASAPISVSAHKTTGEIGAIVIDPGKFLGAVEVHFTDYIAKLRDTKNPDLRSKFNAAWELKNPTGALPLPPGGIP